MVDCQLIETYISKSRRLRIEYGMMIARMNALWRVSNLKNEKVNLKIHSIVPQSHDHSITWLFFRQIFSEG